MLLRISQSKPVPARRPPSILVNIDIINKIFYDKHYHNDYKKMMQNIL